MFADALVAELIDFAHQAVEEVAVVADDNQCAVEVHQRLLQDILGLEVEVVGGLVQNEQVHGFEQQLDHGQAGAFAAGEHLDLLHRGFGTAEHEGAQQVAYLVAYLVLGHVVDGLEDGQVLVEQGGLVLGELAYLHVVAQRQGAFVLNLAHDALHQRGLSLAVAAHEGHLVATLDGERRVLEYHVVAIRLAYAFHDDGVGARAGRRGKFEAQGRGVFFVHFEQLQLLQHLYAALHLQGLGVGSLEAFDELLRLGNELLLFVVGLLLLFAAFLAQFEVFGVVHLVVVDAAHRYLDGAGGDVVHELAVMADDYHCLAVADEEVFEPLDGLDVEVVGGLVEE